MTGPTFRQVVAIEGFIRAAQDRLAHGPNDPELRMEAADDLRRAAAICADAGMPDQAKTCRQSADRIHAPDALSRAIVAPRSRIWRESPPND